MHRLLSMQIKPQPQNHVLWSEHAPRLCTSAPQQRPASMQTRQLLLLCTTALLLPHASKASASFRSAPDSRLSMVRGPAGMGLIAATLLRDALTRRTDGRQSASWVDRLASRHGSPKRGAVR
jgi:hypothetical protein